MTPGTPTSFSTSGGIPLTTQVLVTDQNGVQHLQQVSSLPNSTNAITSHLVLLYPSEVQGFYTALGQRPTLYTTIIFQSPPYSLLETVPRQCCRIYLFTKITPICPGFLWLSRDVEDVQKQTEYRWKPWNQRVTMVPFIFRRNYYFLANFEGDLDEYWPCFETDAGGSHSKVCQMLSWWMKS